jgi:hypothetical protein
MHYSNAQAQKTFLLKVRKKPLADWHALNSPKKTNERFFLLFMAKTKQIRSFVFWENLRRTNLLFGFI